MWPSRSRTAHILTFARSGMGSPAGISTHLPSGPNVHPWNGHTMQSSVIRPPWLKSPPTCGQRSCVARTAPSASRPSTRSRPKALKATISGPGTSSVSATTYQPFGNGGT